MSVRDIPQPLLFLSTKCLLRNEFEGNFGALAVAEINGSLIGSLFFDILGQINLASVDLVPALFADGAADLGRGNTSEDPSAGTGFDADLQRTFIQFGDHVIDLRQHQLLFLPHLPQALLQLFEVAGTALYGQFTGDEEIAGVSVLYFYNFVDTTQVVYVFDENDFHVFVLCTQ